MNISGDTKRWRSVKADFDPDFDATAYGGAVLIEKTARGLGLLRYARKYLPGRADSAVYSSDKIACSLIAALLKGGEGIGAGDTARQDRLLSEILAGATQVASAPTNYRALCDLAGLPQRKRCETYEPAGQALASLDMFGDPREGSVLRRIVPETPEAAQPERLEALDRFTAKFAVKCIKAMGQKHVRMHGWVVAFGDATDLEVDGRCFDAAAAGRDGRKHLRWQTVMLGPVVVAQRLHEGNTDEGGSMPALLGQAREVAREAFGAKARVLELLDAAYFERQVIDPLTFDFDWDFIVGANQQRHVLRRIAEEQPEAVWSESGEDAQRGWRRSQVCCFTHQPEGWAAPVTVVARRWQKADELPGIWHYAFIATRIDPEDLPARLLSEHGYCEALWKLYSTKQGHENHYKTPLRDLAMHHPPSSRLGVNQAFYALASAAANIAMVLRYRVLPGAERGMTLWRMREIYFRIAGRIAKGAGRLTVWLAGANVCAERQVLWRRAFAEAGRL